MLRDPRAWTAAIAFGIASWLLLPHVIGPRPPVVHAEDFPEIAYICRETGEVFELPATNDVLPNPKTGRQTLVPAIRDARSKSWKPGPPLDVRRRMRPKAAAVH